MRGFWFLEPGGTFIGAELALDFLPLKFVQLARALHFAKFLANFVTTQSRSALVSKHIGNVLPLARIEHRTQIALQLFLNACFKTVAIAKDAAGDFWALRKINRRPVRLFRLLLRRDRLCGRLLTRGLRAGSYLAG